MIRLGRIVAWESLALLLCWVLLCSATHAVVTTVSNSTQLLAAVANGAQYIEVLDHIDFRSFDDYDVADSPASIKSGRTTLMAPQATTESIVVRAAVNCKLL